MRRKTEKTRSPFCFLLESEGASSGLVVLLGFLLGSVIVLLVGRNPLNMYRAFLQVISGIFQNSRGVWGWNIRYVGEWLSLSVPYILCGLAMGFAARAGLFNIGAEGQYIAGLTIAQLVVLQGPQLPVLLWVWAILAAIVMGLFWGGLVGYLKARFEVSEVVATIMLNYIALYLSRIITLAIPGTGTYKTADFPAEATIRLPLLERLTNGSTLNMGLFLALMAVFLYWFVMEKTKLGFALRATGFNRDAAQCSGISVRLGIVLSMAFAGAFAGLAGGVVALGSFRYGRVLSGMDNYGFTGIAVALVGNNKALGTLLAGLLFGMLASAQPLMQARQIPQEISLIIQGLIVILISLRTGLPIYFRWLQKKQAQKLQSLPKTLQPGIQQQKGTE